LGVQLHDDGIEIEVGENALDPLCTVIVLDFQTAPVVDEPVIRPGSDGTIMLRAADAIVDGRTARYEHGDGMDNIGFWTNADDTVSWEFESDTPGRFEMHIAYACDPGVEGSTYEIRLLDRDRAVANLAGIVRNTGGWAEFHEHVLGTIDVPEAKRYTLRVIPTSMQGFAVMNLKQITLTPVVR
jgi:hypothetical protein